MAASLASVPELVKNALSAKAQLVTSFSARFTCITESAWPQMGNCWIYNRMCCCTGGKAFEQHQPHPRFCMEEVRCMCEDSCLLVDSCQPSWVTMTWEHMCVLGCATTWECREAAEDKYVQVAVSVTYGVDCNPSRKVQVLFAMCIPHSDALGMSENNVRAHIGLQHISARLISDTAAWSVCQSLNVCVCLSLLFSFDHVTCEGDRILNVCISFLIICSVDPSTSDGRFHSFCFDLF